MRSSRVMAKRQPRATAAEFGPLSSTALDVGEGDSERLDWVGSTVLNMHNIIMYCAHFSQTHIYK